MRRSISPPPNLVRLISHYLSKGQLITSMCQGNLLWSVTPLSKDLHPLVTVLGVLHQPRTANPMMSLRHILPPLTNPRTSCWMHWKRWKAIKSLPSAMPWRSQSPCNISLTPISGTTSPARETVNLGQLEEINPSSSSTWPTRGTSRPPSRTPCCPGGYCPYPRNVR